MSSRRDDLLDSAEDVFCRLGYARTTIGELASAAGVTRPTIYAYFPSKDDVFRALADRVRLEFLALQEKADTSSPERTVREALTAFLAAYTRHYGVLTVIAHQALADPAMRSLRDEMFARVERRNARFLERLVAAGLADPAIPGADLARAVTGLTARSAERAFESPSELPTLGEQLVRCYLRLAGIADG
ncbi:TetR/AcrR family transcriptional regulator [Cryptosporangium arvum]|uniref:Transcriptional regulator n=1 Tax=Cryptosporangium arvum DSM 44712 TaxID=927661 RepID=A0A010YG56_9ACTN|nr:TetR/AcrR family transcriptional regulator [Cryptosporangium arvum]EXG79215.1 transcriptional regulator [Cryptosporangium arvum DSM 44712]